MVDFHTTQNVVKLRSATDARGRALVPAKSEFNISALARQHRVHRTRQRQHDRSGFKNFYTRPRDPDRPLVCLDETSKQLTKETRAPVSMKKGQPARVDYEYERNGTANLFMMFAALEGWRHVKVTERRTAIDYAHALKDLADVHFPNAETIVLVQDNLNTHMPASLYEAFPAPEARRLVERFEWHYTPKTWQLARLGRIRTRRSVHAMPRPSHPRPANPRRGSRGMAARPQPPPHQSRLALHNRKCPRQT
jgi:DDE superfamily endonuclease